MYLDYTEQGLLDLFRHLSREEILEFLLEEGLTLKVTFDFHDVPAGVYRRVDGQDLIYYDGREQFLFMAIDSEHVGLPVMWTLSYGGDRWVQVLDGDHEPVVNGPQFCVNSKGERIA